MRFLLLILASAALMSSRVSAFKRNIPRSISRITKLVQPMRDTKSSGGSGGARGPPNGGPLFSTGEDGDESENNGNEKAMSEEAEEVGEGWMGLSEDTRDDIKTTGISFLIAVLIRFFIVEPRFIPSLSMFPTFDIGDQLLVDKVGKFARGQQGYIRRDVVVFNPPETYIELTGNTEALIKRVVAVEGDSVEVRGRKLFVNDVIQDEPFINEEPDYSLDKVTVPKGCLLVLGDNRNHSFDSHLWGFVPQENVIGRAVFKYWPPWRVGTIEGST
jgi:signal peptidase I